MEPKQVDISIQDLSKIEGHASLDVKVLDGHVEEVHIRFTDNKRFFTQAIQGRNIKTLSQDVARICGTCSIAHTICCIEAIEHTLNIQPSPQTNLLKRLTMHGLMIRDHALHVYLFSLPDVFNKDSVLDFEGEQEKYLQDSFVVKRAGSNLSKAVAGRAVHAPRPQIGAFLSVPTDEDLKKLIPELQDARKKVLDVLEVYYNCKTDYSRETKFTALVGGPFDFLNGNIKSTDGTDIPEDQYLEHLEKTVLPYSQAVGYKFEGDTYMVGALARLNLNKDALHPNTKKDAEKYLKLFPSNNIFHNNLAQAIEILHCIDDALEIIQNNSFKEEKSPQIIAKEGVGVGVIEAPRGVLYYRLFVQDDGTIKEGNIITPTQQNQINMEQDIKGIVQKLIDLNTPKEQIQYELEKLIRAYDPCISCATHFLKVNWTS